MAKLLVLHGPNLNLLGTREPEIYGSTTLSEINSSLAAIAKQAGHQLASFQSNAEADLINRVHQAGSDKVDFILINPGGLTHTSVSLRDALTGVDIPFIEIHLSNIFSRETFRQHSYFSDIARGVISGLGPAGYSLALSAALQLLSTTKR